MNAGFNCGRAKTFAILSGRILITEWARPCSNVCVCGQWKDNGRERESQYTVVPETALSLADALQLSSAES